MPSLLDYALIFSSSAVNKCIFPVLGKYCSKQAHKHYQYITCFRKKNSIFNVIRLPRAVRATFSYHTCTTNICMRPFFICVTPARHSTGHRCGMLHLERGSWRSIYSLKLMCRVALSTYTISAHLWPQYTNTLLYIFTHAFASVHVLAIWGRLEWRHSCVECMHAWRPFIKVISIYCLLCISPSHVDTFISLYIHPCIKIQEVAYIQIFYRLLRSCVTEKANSYICTYLH